MKKKEETKLDIASTSPQDDLLKHLFKSPLAYAGNIDSSQILDQLWNLVHDVQDLSGQLGSANLSATRRNHCDLLGLGQGSSHFSGDLQG